MAVRNLLLTLLGCCLAAGSLVAQELYNQATGLEGEIRMAEVDGGKRMYSIQGLCKNSGNAKRYLSYKLKLTREDPGGNRNSNSQSGEFSVAPGEELVLTEQRINIDEGSIFTAQLYFYEDGALIFADTLMRLFPKKIPNTKKENQGNGAIQSSDPDILGLGLVIDETRTPAGRDLYSSFYSKWQELDVQGEFIIRIQEFPFRFRSSRIKVLLNENVLLERIIQPQRQVLMDLGEKLANYLSYKVGQLDQLQEDLDNEITGGENEVY